MTEHKSVPITKDKAYEYIQIVDAAIVDFKGNLHHLEMAIGMLYLGRQFGWKPLLLIHDKKTIKRSEQILNVCFREILPEVEILAEKSNAWNLVQKASNFWKAVSGEIKGIRSNKSE